MRAEELERAGLSAADARREALRAFGDFNATRRELARSGQRGERQTRWRTMVEDFWRDVRYGTRSLARSPGFATVAVIVLAVGIGANSAAFSLVNVLMRPALVANVDDVVAVYARTDVGGWSGFSYPEYTDLREFNRTFADLAAGAVRDVGLADGDITRRVPVDFVSANYFRTLGVPVPRGREFTAAEEASGRDAGCGPHGRAAVLRGGRTPPQRAVVRSRPRRSARVDGVGERACGGIAIGCVFADAACHAHRSDDRVAARVTETRPGASLVAPSCRRGAIVARGHSRAKRYDEDRRFGRAAR